MRIEISAADLIKAHPQRKPYVIFDLLRRSETMNVIAASKVGKSWTRDALALTTAAGGKWLGFSCVQGRALICDNELHREELSHRLRTVAEAMGLGHEQYADRVCYLPMRGNLQDVDAIDRLLKDVKPGTYDMLFLDALYRALPKDAEENSNSHLARVYNVLDGLAMRLDCAVAITHHSTKGNQSGKAVMDIGAGAGAMGRATDAHVILREHAEPDAAVLEARARSSSPIEPRCLRWQFPLWTVDPTLDPRDLKKAPPRSGKPANGPPAPVTPDWTPKTFTDAFVSVEPRNEDWIKATANERQLADNKVAGLLRKAEAKGFVHRWDNGPNKAPTYATTPQTTAVAGGGRESVLPLSILKGNTPTRTPTRGKTKINGGKQR